MLVKRILLAVLRHPVRHQGSTATNDPRDTAERETNVLAQNPGMYRDIVHALPRLMLDVVEDVVRRERRDVAGDLDGLIDRHRADRYRGGRDDRLANRID